MATVTERFAGDRYEIRQQIFKLFGAAFRIYDGAGQLVLFANQKAFRLREDIRLYTGEDMGTEALSIQTKKILDWSAAYDVCDPATGQKLGALKRKGWKSMLQDEWIVMDAEDQETGVIREDSMLLALVRRFLTNLIPQSYHMEVDGAPVATFKQNFNPFTMKLAVDSSADFARKLDRRMGIAAGVTLCALEGKQQ